VPGVADAQKIIAHWTQWKRHDGGEDSVQIVGINVDDNLERPWNLVQGRVEDLKSPDAIILDELYKQKLGVTRVGEVFETNLFQRVLVDSPTHQFPLGNFRDPLQCRCRPNLLRISSHVGATPHSERPLQRNRRIATVASPKEKT
jgi:hypothetical protein